MTSFDPAVWKAQGEAMQTAADAFYHDAYDVIISKAITSSTASRLDQAVSDGDALCHNPWHQLIAGAYEEMTSVSSRMVGTGSDYAATEEAAANQRFWA